MNNNPHRGSNRNNVWQVQTVAIIKPLLSSARIFQGRLCDQSAVDYFEVCLFLLRMLGARSTITTWIVWHAPFHFHMCQCMTVLFVWFFGGDYMDYLESNRKLHPNLYFIKAGSNYIFHKMWRIKHISIQWTLCYSCWCVVIGHQGAVEYRHTAIREAGPNHNCSKRMP